jgi:predicted ATP-dependent serine protease
MLLRKMGTVGFASGDEVAEMARGALEEYNRSVSSMVEQEASRPGGVFVGRDSELSELEAALDESDGGRGSLFMLAGEPGIGKSRLADELAARARERGFFVLWGRCSGPDDRILDVGCGTGYFTP